MRRAVILVSDDVDFFILLSQLPWEPTDDVISIPIWQAEKEIEQFEISPRSLVIVDWQINVGAGVSPSRILALVKSLAQRGVRVALCADDHWSGRRLLIDAMEAGASSFIEKEVEPDGLRRWLERVLALPLRVDLQHELLLARPADEPPFWL